MKKGIIFDLDGTLLNTDLLIKKSFILKYLNISIHLYYNLIYYYFVRKSSKLNKINK